MCGRMNDRAINDATSTEVNKNAVKIKGKKKSRSFF